MYVCSGCGEEKDESQFSLSQLLLKAPRCRDCRRVANRRYGPRRTRNKAWQQVYKQRTRLRHYGLTDKDYSELLQQQQNRCRICRNSLEPAVVDHDHNTNRVRGLLCHGCNKGLGHFRDNPLLLIRAAFYLLGKLGLQTAS